MTYLTDLPEFHFQNGMVFPLVKVYLSGAVTFCDNQ